MKYSISICYALICVDWYTQWICCNANETFQFQLEMCAFHIHFITFVGVSTLVEFDGNKSIWLVDDDDQTNQSEMNGSQSKRVAE